MSRDQRLNDNWALLHAQNLAVANNAPLVIVFNLVPAFAGATARSYGFMLRALKVLAARAAEEFNIEFQLLLGEPQTTVVEFVASRQASALICDYSPTRVAKKWRAAVADGVHALPSDAAIPVLEVDAHNISPVWHTSNKCEFGARTIRPKVHKAMGSFLVEFPPLKRHPHGSAQALTSAHWTSALDSLTGMDSSVPEVDWCVPGEDAAAVALDAFMGGGGAFARLAKFGDDRNDPTKRSGSSNLSPYLHFGHLSAQRVALEVMRLEARGRSRGVVLESLFPDERTTGPHSFLEELVVRRELSDNFVEYNAHYDSIEGAHAWAQATIEEHRSDPRPILYTRDQLERAATKDDLWNAAQREMVSRGKMHGFLRMYWAKKILEWSPSTEEALASALYLNDKYELDGRDPNGYVGCLWAIAGVHDRAWGPERPIFGKIRYMNYDGCKRKFSIPSYVAANPRLSMNSAKSSSSSASSPKPAFGASK
jgi:deoxyribodipyrimidine photo-lyase